MLNKGNKNQEDIQDLIIYGNKRIIKMNVIKNILGERRFAQGYERSKSKYRLNTLMKERVNKLPINYNPTTTEYSQAQGLTWKEVPMKDVKGGDTEFKQTKNRFESMIRHYPNLVGEMEKSGTPINLTPKNIINKDVNEIREGLTSAPVKQDKLIFINMNAQRNTEKKTPRRINAVTLFHELRHVEQVKNSPNKKLGINAGVNTPFEIDAEQWGHKKTFERNIPERYQDKEAKLVTDYNRYAITEKEFDKELNKLHKQIKEERIKQQPMQNYDSFGGWI